VLEATACRTWLFSAIASRHPAARSRKHRSASSSKGRTGRRSRRSRPAHRGATAAMPQTGTGSLAHCGCAALPGAEIDHPAVIASTSSGSAVSCIIEPTAPASDPPAPPRAMRTAPAPDGHRYSAARRTASLRPVPGNAKLQPPPKPRLTGFRSGCRGSAPHAAPPRTHLPTILDRDRQRPRRCQSGNGGKARHRVVQARQFTRMTATPGRIIALQHPHDPMIEMRVETAPARP